MIFEIAFAGELEKLAKKKGHLGSLLRHALYGAALGGSASLLSSPFVYTALRSGKGLNPKAALLQTLLRIGERTSYGIPLGAAGGWMGYRFFGDKRDKR
jgi:hypothetical protein